MATVIPAMARVYFASERGHYMQEARGIGVTNMVEVRARGEGIFLEAAEWLLRLQAGELSEFEQHQYWRWLRRSPEHVAETLRMLRLKATLARVGAHSPARVKVVMQSTDRRSC